MIYQKFATIYLIMHEKLKKVNLHATYF